MTVKLTEEQRREMPAPVEILDDSTGEQYVLIPKGLYDSYRELAEALESDADPSLFEFDDIDLFDE